MLWIEQNLQVDLFKSLFILELSIEHLLHEIDASLLLCVEVWVEQGTLVFDHFVLFLLLEKGRLNLACHFIIYIQLIINY